MANKKEISQSEASYGSLVQAGRDLAAAAAKKPGYNPTAAISTSRVDRPDDGSRRA